MISRYRVLLLSHVLLTHYGAQIGSLRRSNFDLFEHQLPAPTTKFPINGLGRIRLTLADLVLIAKFQALERLIASNILGTPKFELQEPLSYSRHE